MDIALAVEHILPAAEYRGSVVANTAECWDAVVWLDSRAAKPAWEELEAAWNSLATSVSLETEIANIKTQLEQLDQHAIRPLCTILAAAEEDDVSEDRSLLAHIENMKSTLREQLAAMAVGEDIDENSG